MIMSFIYLSDTEPCLVSVWLKPICSSFRPINCNAYCYSCLERIIIFHYDFPCLNAVLFSGNIKIYFNFLSFLHTWNPSMAAHDLFGSLHFQGISSHNMDLFLPYTAAKGLIKKLPLNLPANFNFSWDLFALLSYEQAKILGPVSI